MNQEAITEARNPQTAAIDTMSSREIVTLINDQDISVPHAVRSQLDAIASAVDAIVGRLRQGGRLLYFGAGTSGRLGVLDASEMPPTFGVSPDLVQGWIAGGEAALRHSIEGAEDDTTAGTHVVQQAEVSSVDAVVGIAASGATPFTLAAVQFAQRAGAFTVGISCNKQTPLSKLVAVAIEVHVGPEVVTGSTRLKAGTAQKMILNMLSTATMIRLGNVYSNLMVNVKLSNRKLINRGIRVIADAVGVTWTTAQKALQEAGDVRSAIVMLQLKCTADEARGLLSHSARLNEVLKRNREGI